MRIVSLWLLYSKVLDRHNAADAELRRLASESSVGLNLAGKEAEIRIEGYMLLEHLFVSLYIDTEWNISFHCLILMRYIVNNSFI